AHRARFATVDVSRRLSTDLELRHEVPDHVFGDFRVLSDQRAELDTGDHKEVNVGQGPQVGRERRVGQNRGLADHLSLARFQYHASALNAPDDLNLDLQDAADVLT